MGGFGDLLGDIATPLDEKLGTAAGEASKAEKEAEHEAKVQEGKAAEERRKTEQAEIASETRAERKRLRSALARRAAVGAAGRGGVATSGSGLQAPAVTSKKRLFGE